MGQLEPMRLFPSYLATLMQYQHSLSRASPKRMPAIAMQAIQPAASGLALQQIATVPSGGAPLLWLG